VNQGDLDTARPAGHDERLCLQCVVCGSSLAGRNEATRHCTAACRVEASRLRAILNGNYSGPYRSVRERLEAAERGVQRALPRRDSGGVDGR